MHAFLIIWAARVVDECLYRMQSAALLHRMIAESQVEIQLFSDMCVGLMSWIDTERRLDLFVEIDVWHNGSKPTHQLQNCKGMCFLILDRRWFVAVMIAWV